MHDDSFCPECGAPKVEGMGCWEQLGALLAWEWEDPELQAEHFLTVASYNIQHPAQFTEEVMAGLHSAYIDYLDNKLTVADIRKRNSKAYEGQKRVLRAKADRHPVLRNWEMTIADVYIPGEPKGAAGRVKAWAAAIGRDLSVNKETI